MGRVFCWAGVVGLVALGGGCAPDAAEPVDDAPPAIPADDPVPAAATESAESTAVTLDRPPLPGDVFFEDPLAIAANSARLPGSDVTPKAMATAEPTPEPEEPEAPKKAAVDWASILPAELLNAEMLRIRDRFAPKLEEISSYNNSLLELPPYLAEMTALAVIAGRHPQDVPWREDAKYIRALSATAAASELTRGQKAYEQVKTPFDKIAALLDGKRPEDLPEASEEGGFLLTTDFGSLMKRLEIGQNSMRTNGGSEAALKENADSLRQEARVMAALATVIASEDFGYGEDQVYQDYATELRQAALDAAKAAKAKDFEGFGKAANAIMQSCNRCHADYRT